MPHDLLKPLLRPARASALRHLAPWLEEPEPEPEPELVSARYWRLHITANNGGATCTVAELKYFDMDNNQLDTFTTRLTAASASSFANASNIPAYAFDLNSTNKWTSHVSGVVFPIWLAFDFGTAVTISKIRLMGQYVTGNQATFAPRDFTLQAANDPGGPWVDVGPAVTGQTGWAGAEERDFVFQSE